MIVAVGGSKGGAGKSTLACNIAAELTRRGSNVLLVDADPQGTAMRWLGIAVTRDAQRSDKRSRRVPTVLAMEASMGQQDQLPRLAPKFDHVIIDGPPRLGEIQRAMFWLADLVLLPCSPSAPDVWALGQSLKLVEAAKLERPRLRGAVVLVRTNPRATQTQAIRTMLKAGCGLPVLTAELGSRVAFSEALAAGEGVTTYAPRGKASLEVAALVDELLGVGRVKPAPSTRRTSTSRPAMVGEGARC